MSGRVSPIKQMLDARLDLGEVFYLVDGDYRTIAQGWSKSDGTGPLDLWAQRNPGRVFYTNGHNSGAYSTDSAAIQAANDAMVDFRGDTMFFTPGSYSPATAVTIDVPDARWTGRPVGHPMQSAATITAGVAAALAIGAAADRMEICWLKFVPLTASHIFAVADGANSQHFHHFFYDANGITANTATQFALVDGAMDNSVIEDFYMHTDAAQGPFIETDGTIENLVIRRFHHYHGANTLAISLLDVDGATTAGVLVEDGVGVIAGGGAVTNLATIADQTANTAAFLFNRFTGTVGYCGATALVAVAGTGAEANITNCWLALADAAVAATVNYNVTSGTVPWQTFTPYTS